MLSHVTAPMRTVVIAGGNSGIGLQVARRILSEGHRILILGRDQQKGEDAIASFATARERAIFLRADLSTHAGVRDAARTIVETADRIDGLLHSTGVFATKDVRTADGLTLFFAVTYLGRYHLTQLLLPALARAERPRIVMMTARLQPVPKMDLGIFPNFERFDFRTMGPQINAANLFYADHLAKTFPNVFAGVVNAGFARTDIFRSAPWSTRLMVSLIGPFLSNSIAISAYNPARAVLEGKGPPAYYWNKPGDFKSKIAIQVDDTIRNGIVEMSRQITGI